MTAPQRRLQRLTRALATLDLFAFLATILPADMIGWQHERLGMGTFPDAPVAIYLVRTASMLYGLCGVLLWFLSSDIPRYRPVIQFIARSGLAAGLLLILIDLASGMPGWWVAMEGPSCLVLWGLVAWACHRCDRELAATGGHDGPVTH